MRPDLFIAFSRERVADVGLNHPVDIGGTRDNAVFRNVDTGIVYSLGQRNHNLATVETYGLDIFFADGGV